MTKLQWHVPEQKDSPDKAKPTTMKLRGSFRRAVDRLRAKYGKSQSMTLETLATENGPEWDAVRDHLRSMFQDEGHKARLAAKRRK